MNRTKLKEFLPLLSALLACGLLVVDCISLRPWILDDAFIFLRYAQNWIHGQGLVYNPGERVEGYTSFLWVLLLGGMGRAGFDLVFSAKLLGYFFSMATFFLLAFAQKFWPPAGIKVRVLAPLLLVATRTFSPWARSGMEVPLFSFLFLLFLLNYVRIQNAHSTCKDFFVQGCMGVLLLMTRPEGAFIYGAVLLDCLARGQKEGRNKAVFILPPLFLFYVPYFFWRYHYYGFLFPNTYYVKVGSGLQMLSRGWQYVRNFLTQYAMVCVLLLAAPLCRHFKKHRMDLFSGVILIFFMYVAYVGGDYVAAFRFFAPLTPLMALCAAWVLANFVPDRRAFILICALILPQQWLSAQGVHNYVRATTFIAKDGQVVGQWLRQEVAPGSVFATNSAGAISYYSGLYTIDMLGLNDKHIAHTYMPLMGVKTAGHEKGNGPYVLLKKPDFIQFGPPYGRETPELIGDAEIARSPSFRELYRLKKYRLPTGRELQVYELKK